MTHLHPCPPSPGSGAWPAVCLACGVILLAACAPSQRSTATAEDAAATHQAASEEVVAARNSARQPVLSKAGRLLPHAVLVEDENGRKRHLHIAPVVEGGGLTGGFGIRRHSMGGGSIRHTGIDIAAAEGTPVRAAAGGRIVKMGWLGGYGRFVLIRHTEGLDTAYGHLSGYAEGLAIGRLVAQDQVIGYVGSSGRSTGPHLHYEIRRNGKAADPLGFPHARRGR